MRNRIVWERACGLTRTVVEAVDVDEVIGAVIVSARPEAKARQRCGQCGRRCPKFDRGEGRRRWRALDAGTMKVFIEADAPRVRCRDHGVTVAQVPWARHGAGHTRDFDDQAAWLAVHASKSAVVELLRVAWRTVGSIIARVNADIDANFDRFAGLERIGIDEISYKRGHRFLIVVVDHDTGRLVWAAPGRDEATLHRFFDQLGEDRAAHITHVSADMASWIARVVAQRAPNAVRSADPFHVVAWASDALDVERRLAWNQAAGRRKVDPSSGRRKDATGPARAVKRSRYALWKNPENLTPRQREQLDWIAKTDPRLWRAYLLKEGLRYVFAAKGEAGRQALDRWISWARRSRLPAFVDLQRRVVKHRAAIEATLDSGLSNALVESTNTKIRLLTRVAFGFHGPEPLIALAMLALGGHTPDLPGRRMTHG
ncbi:MAG TPA: ISL3 family transposase [Microthrixaceae bacterium]|nr:ISL3 family transposase [Microthrixaceae bacterium]